MTNKFSLRYLSVNSLAPELTARVSLMGRVKVRNWVRVEVRFRVRVRVRVRVSASISVNNNNSGAGELTDKYPPCLFIGQFVKN